MIAIIDYGAGNIRSVSNALQRMGTDCILTADAEKIRSAEKVIFPGVGEASYAMENLKRKKLDTLIPTLTQPFLGICLGMQLMCKETEEGSTKGLGIFNSEVKKFQVDLKVPHMGWNNHKKCQSKIFNGIDPNHDFYFVHSYYAEPCEHCIATSEYGITFSTAMQKDNFWAVQFHPEKSGKIGEQLLKNFLEL